MLALFVSRNRGGVTTFGIIANALVMSTMLPYSVVIWGYATPAYASPQTSAVTGGLVAVPSLPPASLQEQADPIRRLPDDVMRSVLGGPEDQESCPDLKSPTLVLASLSPSAAGTLASRIVPVAAADSCTGLMDAVMAEAAAGDVEGAIAAAFPVLSRFPNSHEAERARLVVENQLSGATPIQLATLASTVLTRGAPVTATEGAAACRIVWTHAQSANAPESYDYVIRTAGSMLSNWPNAPEAIDLVPMYLGSLEALGRSGEADALLQNLSGTLAAWRMTEQRSGQAPPWETLSSAEACYGLLAAWHNQVKQAERVKATLDTDFLERACALGNAALWAYPASAAQTRNVPLYFGFLDRLSSETRKARLLDLIQQVNAASSSLGTWMARIFLYRECLFHDFDRHTGAFHLMNAFDDAGQGVVDDALGSAEVAVRDKARLEYYLGYCIFNTGDEDGAVLHYDRALLYDTSDVVLDTALYARAYALEILNDYTGDYEQSVQEYQAYLAAHGYGRNAGHAVLALGRVYERAGDNEGACDFFKYLLEQYPGGRLQAVAAEAVERLTREPSAAYARGNRDGSSEETLQLCGPVALRKMLALSNISAEVNELAVLAGTDASGTTMHGLVEAARAKGFALTGVQAARGAGIVPPYLAFVNGNHFVLVRDSNETAVLVDDVHASVPEWIPRDVFSSLWDGVALVKESDPALAQVLERERLELAKGGQEDPLPEENHMECQNWEFCCKCPPCSPPPGGPGGPGGPGFPNGPHDPGPPTGPGPIYTTIPPTAPDEPGPGNPGPGGPNGGATGPSKCVKGANPEAMLFQVSPSLRETDLRMTTKSGLVVSFTRHFMTAYGFMRAWYSAWPDDLPYKNHIGNSWNHNYNMHLRPSQFYGSVMFVDEQGDIRTYTRITNEGEYHAYTRQKPAYPWEKGVILKRHIPTGTWTAHFPSGLVYGFAQETAWGEHYARLEYIENRSGQRLTMQYDGQGRLIRILPPTGDDRYLELQYSGNRVVQAQLRDTTTVFEAVYYEYNQYLDLTWVHRGNPSNDDNDISIYTYGADPNVTDSYFMTSRTDSAGVTTGMAYVYGQMYDWGMVTTEMTLQRGNLLKTHYKRYTSSATTRVQNLDENDVPINKIEYTGDSYAGSITAVVNYLTPTSSSASRWAYTYSATDKFMTAVYRPNTTANGGTTSLFEEYTYTPEGKYASVSRYAPGAPNNKLTTTFEYDTSGQLLVERTDPDGLATEYDYDGYGRLIQMTHPSLGVNGFQYGYDTQGNRTSVTDPLGNTTSFTYDALGNMTSTTNALNQTTTMTYDDLGRVSTVTDPLNNTTEYEYIDSTCGCGGTGKLARITDALNNVTEFEYDLAGNRILARDALNRETAYEYDALNRMTAIEAPAGSNKRTTFSYNRLGHLVSRTDFLGRTTTMTYDHQGRQVTVTDPIGTISYAYNPAGMLTSVTDELGRVTTYAYDSGLRPSFEYNALAKFRKIYYDAQGRVVKTGGGTGATIDPVEYFYSAATGLRTKTRYWSGASYYDADYVYDGAARLTRINDWLDATVGIQYAYDVLGRLSTLTDYSLSKQLTYTYDTAGRIASMTDYNGLATNYTYTARGELATISAPGGKVWTFAYNALGQRTQYTHPNGIRTEYGYDSQNRLASILHKDATTNTVLDGFTYTLNDGGGITRIDHADGSYWTYAYDNRDRLTGAIRRNSQDGILHLYGYNYDNADNMTQWGRYQTSDDRTDIWAYTYNAGNQQLTMTLNGGTAETRTYDDLGRLATRVQGSYSASYAYRYASRLYQATSNFPGESNVTLDYGADGKLRTRTTATETRRYRYDRGWNPVIEEVGGGTVATNFFEPSAPVGQVLAQALGTGTAYTVYATHDHLATVRHWRYANKASARAIEYDPYGNFYAQSGYLNMPRIFALHEFDTSLQQYRAPYRNYSPTMARWTTMDPAGMVDGPNMYAYVGNSPANSVDRDGLFIAPPIVTACCAPCAVLMGVQLVGSLLTCWGSDNMAQCMANEIVENILGTSACVLNAIITNINNHSEMGADLACCASKGPLNAVLGVATAATCGCCISTLAYVSVPVMPIIIRRIALRFSLQW